MYCSTKAIRYLALYSGRGKEDESGPAIVKRWVHEEIESKILPSSSLVEQYRTSWMSSLAWHPTTHCIQRPVTWVLSSKQQWNPTESNISLAKLFSLVSHVKHCYEKTRLCLQQTTGWSHLEAKQQMPVFPSPSSSPDLPWQSSHRYLQLLQKCQHFVSSLRTKPLKHSFAIWVPVTPMPSSQH